MAAIEIENLTRHYGRRRGIEGVSFSVEKGALFGFLGPNGAGKTTTIRVLLGFLRPEAGRAAIFGLDCWHAAKKIKRDCGRRLSSPAARTDSLLSTGPAVLSAV